ncbi:MAG: peptide-methionine (S)-S-oxide reductase MsrA [Burkholderiales bacterium]
MIFRLIAAIALTLASAAASAQPKGLETAIFAGGCFWCVESDFDKVPGVVSTTSGYTGGHTAHPTYEEVSSGSTGHAESVEIRFDPKVVSYQTLLRVYWHSIDPTVKDRQFCDVGTQYRTAIFYLNDEQKRLAEQSKSEIARTKPFKAPIVTEIAEPGTFWPAEEYHQDYYKKNPLRYHFYREGCGRDARVKQLWGSEAGRP